MKTLFKILRSTFTSLLFVILTFGIIVQFIFTITNANIKKVKNLIEPESLLEDYDFENENIRKLALEYIDGYIDYIFSKRSYPSIQTLDTKNLTEEEKSIAERALQELQKNTDLDYKTVAKMRDVSNSLTNKSIYLMINIGVFLAFLVLTIILMDFKKSFKLFSISVSLSGTLAIILFSTLLSKVNTLNEPFMKTLLTSILDDKLTSTIYKTAFIYILLGIILFFTVFIINRTLSKRQILTK